MATTEHSDLEQQIIKTAQQLFIEKQSFFCNRLVDKT